MPDTLYDSPAEVVAKMLIDLGIGSNPATTAMDDREWPVHAAAEPDLPDDCVTVYDTVGRSHGRSMPLGKVLRHVGFQVRVRGVDHRAVNRKADEIHTVLAEDVYQETVSVDGRVYLVHAAATIGDVLNLGKEPGTKRSLATVNATTTIRRLS